MWVNLCSKERESIEWNNARQVLADEETKLYDQLDKSNELSFPGFELKGMANPEWNQLRVVSVLRRLNSH